MSQTISIDKTDVPLWKLGTGSIDLTTTVSNLKNPVPPQTAMLAEGQLALASGQRAIFKGDSGTSLKLSAGIDTSIQVQALFKDDLSSDLLGFVEHYGLAANLTTTNFLLATTLGASGRIEGAGVFRFNVLKAGATLKAGADGVLVQIRPYDRQEPIGDVLADNFSHLTLPSEITVPPRPGEVVSLELGGYLKLGASLSAGFEVKGTPSLEVGKLRLSEHYKLAVTGALSVGASLAGRFRVEVRACDRPGWARVIVHRQRSREFKLAADVSVNAILETKGLPGSGKEFLGALLGVQPKNWLNLLDGVVNQAGQLQSLDDLKKRLDDLAGDFLEAWLGKTLENLPVEEITSRIEKVVKSYRDLDSRAIALLDRFLDPVTGGLSALEHQLDRLSQFASWESLQGKVDPKLWNVLAQLTDGDPLDWILGQVNLPDPLAELQKRVQNVRDLLGDTAHEEIRNLIRTAKEKFDLDDLLDQLAALDSPEELRSAASAKLKDLVTRITGRAIDATLGKKDLSAVWKTVKAVAGARQKFWKTFDKALEEAAKQTVGLQLQAGYSHAEERDALVDVEIRLQDEGGQPVENGRRLMRAAGRGDFATVLADYKPDLVRVRDGLLTRRLTKTSRLLVNVVGWHLNFNYQRVDQLVVNAQQRIRSNDYGQLTVFTEATLKLDKEKLRDKNTRDEERMQTNFTLRLLGETHGVVDGSNFDPETRTYLVEVISGYAARYALNFSDKKTRPEELKTYLAFAKEVGLDRSGATLGGVQPYLTVKDGSYGPIEARYEVRYGQAALQALFRQSLGKEQIRHVLRMIIVASYAKTSGARRAWAFATPAVLKLWQKEGRDFAPLGTSPREFSDLDSPLPNIAAPPSVVLSRPQLRLLDALYHVQKNLVGAFQALQKTLAPQSSAGPGGNQVTRLSLPDFERRLEAFGKTLQAFEKGDRGPNTVFAVFDGLVRMAGAPDNARASTLRIDYENRGRKSMVFVSPGSAP